MILDLVLSNRPIEHFLGLLLVSLRPQALWPAGCIDLQKSPTYGIGFECDPVVREYMNQDIEDFQRLG